MTFAIPQSLKTEHDELHADLKRATKAGGLTGAAAVEVARLMHPHFVKEEEYALPPLGLLADLAAGKTSQGMADVLPLTDRLARELPTMLAEHQQIVAALQRLREAAASEQKPDIAAFADRLMAHAQTEEQVAYPAALLVGRYVKAMVERTPAAA
jgi:hypothetical protein